MNNPSPLPLPASQLPTGSLPFTLFQKQAPVTPAPAHTTHQLSCELLDVHACCIHRQSRGGLIAHGSSLPLIHDNASKTRVSLKACHHPPPLPPPPPSPCRLSRSTLALDCPVLQLPSNCPLLDQKSGTKIGRKPPGPAVTFLKSLRLAS